MILLNTSKIEEKKSKFFGYLFLIENNEDINNIINQLKDENKNAKHFPFAYIYNNSAKKSDDKEPNGTAGNPIYYIMEKNELKNNMIVIVRYYGGIKLGTGLLTRTYMKCASLLIKK